MKKKHILQEKSNQGTEEKENKPRKASGLGGDREENELQGSRSCA